MALINKYKKKLHSNFIEPLWPTGLWSTNPPRDIPVNRYLNRHVRVTNMTWDTEHKRLPLQISALGLV